MVNIWHAHDLRAGDDLVLRLKPMPLPPNRKYTLNHFPKSLSEIVFSGNAIAQVNAAMAGRVPNCPPVTSVWQLVPDLFHMDIDRALPVNMGLPLGFAPPAEFCWQQEGYWHIARTQVRCNKYGYDEYYYNDMANNLRTGHLDVTFQPTYYAVPYRNVNDQVGPRSSANVLNVLGESVSGSKREWRGTLRIERGFESSFESGLESNFDEGLGCMNEGDDGVGGDVRLTDDGSDSMFKRIRAGAEGEQGARRVRWQDSASHWQQGAEREDWVGAPEPAIVPLMIASELGSGMTGGRSSGMTEDIGVFEEAPSAIPRISTAPAASSEFSDHMVISAGGSGVTSTSLQSSESGIQSAAASSATPFVVPKPVLKGGKRPPARGKGVMGTVLAADGSVTHEASRIL